jgi:hypothetical protein
MEFVEKQLWNVPLTSATSAGDATILDGLNGNSEVIQKRGSRRSVAMSANRTFGPLPRALEDSVSRGLFLPMVYNLA